LTSLVNYGTETHPSTFMKLFDSSCQPKSPTVTISGVLS
jgi:hypothetical protein